MYCVCITTHSKYIGQRQRHTEDEVHNAARPYSDLNLLLFLLLFSLFSLISGSLKPKSLFSGTRALSQAPSIYTTVDPLKGSYTKVKSGTDVRQGVQRIFKTTFSSFRTCIQLSLAHKFLACKITLMLMAFSVRARFDVSIR